MKMNRRAFLSRGTAAASFVAGGSLSRILADGDAKTSPVVETAYGKLRGSFEHGVNVFRGVPYGGRTDGELRFLPPEKPHPWKGVGEALEFGPIAMQIPSRLIPEVQALDPGGNMDENCLVLNVWSAGLSAGDKRPVMVWLHGGGYSSGSGAWPIYGGAELAAKHNVVVVTLNHRLNAFGFLYLAGTGSSKFAQASNVGMLDIVAALEWVRDNISNFGGDPSRVTIFGESGGGGKVSVLMAMPAAKGLFHRAIVESGAALKLPSAEQASKAAEEFLAEFEIKPQDAEKIDDYVPQQILAGLHKARGAGSGPVVDGKTIPADPFDPAAPAMSANIPLLIGSNATEATFMATTPLAPMDDAALLAHVKQNARVDNAKAQRLIAAYKKEHKENIDAYLALASDLFMGLNVATEADRKAAQPAPVYKYYFAWKTPVRDGLLRTPHTLEIPFVFDHPDTAKSLTGEGQDRYALAETMSAAWAAFAHTGNPNHKGLAQWPVYKTDRRLTMVFDDKCRVEKNPGGEGRAALRAVRA